MGGMVWPLVGSGMLLGLAVVALAWSARLRGRSGLPGGEVVSSDMGMSVAGARRGKPLFSAQYRLTGTPDYVVRTARGLVPVEVKPGRTEGEPRESHLLQVLAYCLLIEEIEGKRPPYGLLRYSAETFKVDYNAETRAYLLGVMEQMRETAELEEWQVERSHSQPGRCRACSYRTTCDQSLWQEVR